MAFKVTPWEVSGDVDYDKLIKQFGTERIDDALLRRIQKHSGRLHHFLRRRLFFSHRDMNWLIDQHEKGREWALYTGRGPSGHTHLGHLIPWMFTKWLSDTFNVPLYFQLTDDEKFLFKETLSLEEANGFAHENALDMIALGFSPKRLKILIDTEHAGLMYPEAIRVAKKITYSTTKAVFGFTNDTNIGQIFYTSMQAVPAMIPSILAGKKVPVLIPHAIDQDPHFRVARDVLPKIGYEKPASIHCRFLPALYEGGKMSASVSHTAIYTTDTAKQVRDKVNKYAFSGGRATVEEHRKKGGDPDIDVSFQYLTYFEEDDKRLQSIRDDYESGKMLSGELKAILIEKLNRFLVKHQEKREKARTRLDKYLLKA
ncbi:MAG: tryptophan--tRNA ligase [DPANN group archaeon]|nr:tryptophan--tRNA ligase [DPANN group archaeon]